ncbi:MAG: hypothetical protein KME14_15575 [Tildeniella torsiva UHER 1998/13D]|jgi:hypothetical protein|nr:hypothetical protein [Tildeniella torsiva UHER 1998/13D]
MPEPLTRQLIPLAEDFFCDGHYYLLTSGSLGGSEFTAEKLSNALGQADEQVVKNLLMRGICIPLFFDGDCALDGHTVVVLGDLSEQEEHVWIAKLSWKLAIPCGKFVIHCGGGDADELAYAIAGNPPEPNYRIFQIIDVPPGEYSVEIYAYLSSMTVQLSLEEYDNHWNLKENTVLKEWYQLHRPGLVGIGYIIQLTPLKTEPPFPEFVPEIGWLGKFEFRQAEL